MPGPTPKSIRSTDRLNPRLGRNRSPTGRAPLPGKNIEKGAWEFNYVPNPDFLVPITEQGQTVGMQAEPGTQIITMGGSRLTRGLLLFAFWTFLGVSFAGQFYIASAQLNRAVSWHQALYYSLADWYVFATLSCVPIYLARHYGLEEGHWRRNVTLHLCASLVFSVCYVILRTAVAKGLGWLMGQPVGFGATFKPLLFKTWHFNLLIYWVILTVYHAVDFYRKYQERNTRSLQLEKRLAEARLLALQMQLNPHFLYNTLHAISSLMYQDVQAADRMIARLSQLLRYALQSTDQQEVPLRQELEFLRRYVEIEQARFGNRLNIEIQIDPHTESCLIPNLILQPLVENAIHHGIEPHASPGTIRIQSSRTNDRLTLQVNDTGLTPVSMPVKEGVGLSNTRARLRQLYGERQSFALTPGPDGGLQAVITLPCRPVASATASG